MNKKTFIVAEVGLAHDGSLGIAKSFIDKISASGADAVKFQIHDHFSESSKYEVFKKKFSFQDKNRSEYWNRTKFNASEWSHLIKYAKSKNLKFIISPFSIESFEKLKKFGVDAWKIASGEFTNLPLVEHIKNNSNKPIILSTGLTYDKEIKKVLDTFSKIKKRVTLLQCTSIYPAPVEKVGHNILSQLKGKYKIKVGISDHSGNKNSIITGITYGADIIETHVTFDKKFFGPDTSSSITFDDLKEITQFNNDYNKIKTGKIKKNKLSTQQKSMRRFFCKSIMLKKKLVRNQMVTMKDIRFVKPFIGISALEYKKVLRKKVKKDINKGSFLKWSDLK